MFGWEGQHYRTIRIPIGDVGVVEATSIDLFIPSRHSTAVDEPLTRIVYFTHNTNAFYAQDHLTLGPKVKAMVGGRVRHLPPDQPQQPGHRRRRDRGAAAEARRRMRSPAVWVSCISRISVDLYGSFANSFRPLTQAQPDGTTLEPEIGRQVEFGQRFHMLGDRVQLNTAVFHIVRENVAFSRPGGFFDQASEVKSRGFEADISTSPVSNWRINGGYGSPTPNSATTS